MRKVSADWQAVEAALEGYQIRTIEDFAEARGLSRLEWALDPVVAFLAVSLAVERRLAQLMHDGLTERRAVACIATELDLDVETLIRSRRRLKRARVLAAARWTT